MTQKQSKFDLGWGNPYFLLKELNELYYPNLSVTNVLDMSYAPDEGNLELVNMTRKVIKETTGIDYKYIVITNGATHALNAIFRLSKRDGFNEVLTREYGYPYYEDMISRAGLERVIVYPEHEELMLIENDQILLMDSPSNPRGLQTNMGLEKSTIWDSVYHNKIYTNDLETIPSHFYNVGSYSKLLGVTGARIGWIATNNEFTYKRVVDECLKDNATISKPSQNLIIDILKKVNLDELLVRGKRSIDNNREELQRIEYLFDNQAVQSSGMFYCAFGDKKTIELLNKCGIIFVNLGNNYIRLSLGQTNNVTKEAVITLLNEDKIK